MNAALASTGCAGAMPNSFSKRDASTRAQRFPFCACFIHAPFSSTPTQPDAINLIFEASCPACLHGNRTRRRDRG